jgi:hypothetical protein
MFTVPQPPPDNFNFSMPTELADEFRRLGDPMGPKNKFRWAVAAVAVLRLLELPDDRIERLIDKVIIARRKGALPKMIAAAKRRAAERKLAGGKTAYDRDVPGELNPLGQTEDLGTDPAKPSRRPKRSPDRDPGAKGKGRAK